MGLTQESPTPGSSCRPASLHAFDARPPPTPSNLGNNTLHLLSAAAAGNDDEWFHDRHALVASYLSVGSHADPRAAASPLRPDKKKESHQGFLMTIDIQWVVYA